MKRVMEAEIDPAPLVGKTVAIMGYGNQGRPQALNLKDSGVDVIIGLRNDSPSAQRVEQDGLRHTPMAEAVAGANLIMMLVPDEAMSAVYRSIESSIRQGATLAFSHGLAIRFGFIKPRQDLDVVMVAPKGPGTALRSLYVEGKGMVALYAVHQDATGEAERNALAYGRAIGCARAGMLRSSFAEECEADLFNEHAVVWGGVPELLIAGFDTLVEAGVSPEVAYMECVDELKLIAELVETRGLAGMREAISNTAELGGVLGGPLVVTPTVRQHMRNILASIRSGAFARKLADEEASGYPLLKEARKAARTLPVEQARKKLSS